MKKIDLGESAHAQPMSMRKGEKYYPNINFGDNGQDGEPTFSEDQIGKMMKVTAHIKLTSIGSRSDSPSGKRFDYSFEIRSIEMPEEKR